MDNPKPTELASFDLEDGSSSNPGRKRGLLNLGQKLSEAATVVGKMTAIAGEVISRTAASATELLADKELRRKGADYLLREGSKVVQELQKGVGQGVEVIGRRIQQGAAFAQKRVKIRYQELMARLEPNLREQLKERRQLPVDVQIGHEVYENVPQELRSRLWYVVLEQPDILKPFMSLQHSPGSKTHSCDSSLILASAACSSGASSEQRRSKDLPTTATARLDSPAPDRLLKTQQSLKELKGQLQSGIVAVSRELSVGIRDAINKLSSSPSRLAMSSSDIPGEASPQPSSTHIASETVSLQSQTSLPPGDAGMHHVELKDFKAVTEQVRAKAHEFTACLDMVTSVELEPDISEALRTLAVSLSNASHSSDILTTPAASETSPDKPGVSSQPDGTRPTAAVARNASDICASPFATLAPELSAASASSTLSRPKSPGSDNAMDEWEFVTEASERRWSPAMQAVRERILADPVLPQARQALVEALTAVPWPLPLGSNPIGIAEAELLTLPPHTGDHDQNEVDEIITRDINRTFPEHPQFGAESGQQALFRVLKAYSLRDKEVGYCQGMAFGAGVLLMYLPEDMAYRAFVKLLDADGCNLRRLYLPGLEGLKQELAAFEILLQQIMPQLSAHLESHGVPSVLYASQWFMTMFACPFPVTFAARVLDIMLQEGTDNILLRLALSVMSLCSSELLKQDDFEHIVTDLKVKPLNFPVEEMRNIFEWAHGSAKDDATDDAIRLSRVRAAAQGLRTMSRRHSSRPREGSLPLTPSHTLTLPDVNEQGDVVGSTSGEATAAGSAAPVYVEASTPPHEGEYEQSEGSQQGSEDTEDMEIGLDDIVHPLASLDQEHLEADAAIESASIAARHPSH